ncbi:hypothetical protein KKE60_05805 [Patescibacteria group bacterium]|nr:hypothetical protein [Patescibacteria group bacterium]
MAIAKINYAILCGKKQGVTRTPPNWEAPWVAQTPKGMVLANSKREAHAIMKNVMPLPPAMAINKKNPRAKRRKTPESIAFFKSVSTDGYRDVLTLKDGTKVSRLVDTGHISIRRRGQSVEEYPPGTVQRDAMEKTFFTDDVEMKLYSQHIGFPTSRGNPSKNWEKRIKDATKMRSKGHVGFAGESEYFFGIDGTLYRAHILDVMDVHGYRAGARFEATAVAAPYLLETLGLKTKRNPLFGASPGSEMDRLMKRGELQISFSTDKRGRPLAWRWSGVGQWRWFRIPYE